MVTLVAQFSISGSILSLNTPKQLWAVGLLVLGTQEEEAIYDILKISSPHSLIAELLGSADSKVVLQECSTEICPAKWGNAMQRLPQMSLENIQGYFLRTRAGTESHNMQTNLNWKVLR